MKFIAEGDELTLRLEGFEVILGIARRLVIPRSAIVSLDWHPVYDFAEKIWRSGGAGIPGVLYAGHFRGAGKRYFLYLKGPQGLTWMNGNVSTKETLVIKLQNYKYDQILITCNQDNGMKLRNWWHTT